METTFEYCALQYLGIWLKNDKPNGDLIANDNPNGDLIANDIDEYKNKRLEAIQKAMSFYSVARTLPKKVETRYTRLLKIIDNISELNKDNLQTIINDVKKYI